MSNNKERLVVVGGVAGGMSAAAKARRVNPQLEITVFERGAHVSYGACGMPYYISGAISTAQNLIARTPEQFAKRNIQVNLHHEVTAIDAARRIVAVRDLQNEVELTAPYDKLLIGTGASAVTPPPFSAENLPKGVFVLRSLKHGIAIRKFIEERKPARAVIVGGGYIGLEMAEAFRVLGMDITILGPRERVMSRTYDADMANIIQEELARQGVKLIIGERVAEIIGAEYVQAVTTQKAQYSADIVLLAIGVTPNVAVARTAGVELGETGAIAVNERMETSVPGIYAAGDCAETRQLVTGTPIYLPLGHIANKQGRAAGTNIGGGSATFAGAVGTAVVKVFDLEAARTGLTETKARALGFDVAAPVIKAKAIAGYYPGATPLHVKLVVDNRDGRVLGGQIVGKQGAAKRIDVVAVAAQRHMTIAEVQTFDMSYAPPFAPVWDPILIAANVVAKE